jgi:hypothetical protein
MNFRLSHVKIILKSPYQLDRFQEKNKSKKKRNILGLL